MEKIFFAGVDFFTQGYSNIEDLGEMVKYIERATFVIDKTGMIRAIWRNPEDLREHPASIWEFIQKEKK